MQKRVHIKVRYEKYAFTETEVAELPANHNLTCTTQFQFNIIKQNTQLINEVAY